MGIEFDPTAILGSKWSRGDGARLEQAWPKAVSVSSSLRGRGRWSVIDQQEEDRADNRKIENSVGIHHVSNSVIEEMICKFLNENVTDVQFYCFIGAMVVPPPSYIFSLPLFFSVAGGAFSAIGDFLAMKQVVFNNFSKQHKEDAANLLATTLSHLHTNLRQGDLSTNSSTGGGVDPRFSSSAGLDPIAYVERAYQHLWGGNRPILAAESIYALSMVRLSVPGRENEEFTTRTGGPRFGPNVNLLSSVSGTDKLYKTVKTNNDIMGASDGAISNPFRRAAHIPKTRYVMPFSWSTMLIGMLIMYFLLR